MIRQRGGRLYLECDRCHGEGAMTSARAVELRALAHKAGWRQFASGEYSLDACPACEARQPEEMGR